MAIPKPMGCLCALLTLSLLCPHAFAAEIATVAAPSNLGIEGISTLEEGYNGFLLGPSSTRSFSVEDFNQLYEANFYNLAMYGADFWDYPPVLSHLLDSYQVDYLVLNLPLTALLADEEGQSLATQGYALPEDRVSTVDQSLRDVESVGSLEDYLLAHSEFEEDFSQSVTFSYTQAVLDAVEEMVALCQANDVELIVVTEPSYSGLLEGLAWDDVAAFYTELAQLTPFWDFSLSSISYDPRYFYDPTHFRSSVGEMATAVMMGDTVTYRPDDFGTYITADMAQDYFAQRLEITYTTAEENATSIPILMYHHFADEGLDGATMTIQGFEEHLIALQTYGYTPISFDQLLAYVNEGTPLPEHPVILTLDDGYASNYELAYPLLVQYEMQATIFAIGSSIGKDTYLDTDIPIYPHFTLAQGQEMVESGLISIQSHTYNMHQWADYHEEVARTTILPLEGESVEDYTTALIADFTQSKTQLEDALGTAVKVLAYPTGKYCNLSQYILTTLGVEVTLSTQSAVSTAVMGIPQSLYAMERFTMSDEISPQQLLTLLEGSSL